MNESKNRVVSPELKLRAVEPEDASIIWEIECDSCQWVSNGMMAPMSMHVITEYALNYDADPYRSGQLRMVAYVINQADDTKKTVGLVDLYDISARNHTAFTGIYVREEYRGLGYGREMLRLIERYAFNVLNIRMLAARIASVNAGSWKLYESSGFEKAGTLRNWICLTEGMSDLTIYQKCLNT